MIGRILITGGTGFIGSRVSLEAAVVASTHAVYGEGVSCAEHGVVDPPAAAPCRLLGRRFEPRCPVIGPIADRFEAILSPARHAA